VSGDAVRSLSGLEEHQAALSRKAERLLALRDSVRDEVERYEAEVDRQTLRIEQLGKTSELLRFLIDSIVEQQVKVVEDIVTEGLQTIFFDQDLSFESAVEFKRDRVWVEVFIRNGSKKDPLSHRGKPLDSSGGGPSSVASLVLRVLTLLRLKRYPLLILDEALGAVSDEYVELTGQFLSQLTQNTGMDILLVTHKPAFMEHARKSFRVTAVDDGSRKRLSLKAVKS
jgi:chromosome segregation ATPase